MIHLTSCARLDHTNNQLPEENMIVVVFALFFAGYKGYKELKRKQQSMPLRVSRSRYGHLDDSEYDSEILSDEADIDWCEYSPESALVL